MRRYNKIRNWFYTKRTKSTNEENISLIYIISRGVYIVLARFEQRKNDALYYICQWTSVPVR